MGFGRIWKDPELKIAEKGPFLGQRCTINPGKEGLRQKGLSEQQRSAKIDTKARVGDKI